ncbi:hypothetical protein SARC_02451 [Sphaeroforma arctica JP610]|uniref:Uncharacterized protein n=1 Tax=Sphaeroforma arctica JP610 TaxID=667725 RepID=A0A0L0G8X3_9EUKA|nr:hypothetical protein SARC_02451 [Sphaeroforma arctica JP610]KNC85359.1 hypothetical protein SARC_02451 [Sphaeroforma arctica JP610]|eukprot:XP_014159261.1 hypothetical protein SARC_02451 [Sphaeroforma arctica JP610]
MGVSRINCEHEQIEEESDSGFESSIASTTMLVLLPDSRRDMAIQRINDRSTSMKLITGHTTDRIIDGSMRNYDIDLDGSSLVRATNS